MRVQQLTPREVGRLPQRDLLFVFAVGRLPRRSAGRVRITRMGDTVAALGRRYQQDTAGAAGPTEEGHDAVSTDHEAR